MRPPISTHRSRGIAAATASSVSKESQSTSTLLDRAAGGGGLALVLGDRPVEEGIERQVVALEVHRHRVRGLDRRPVEEGAAEAAKAGGAMEAHYAASKSAVVALTRAAAIEWGGHGVTVNAICPGYVLTEMGAGTRTEEQVAQWTAKSPLGRLGVPDDVAGLVAYLATDGGYVTGQALNVTGGMVMH